MDFSQMVESLKNTRTLRANRPGWHNYMIFVFYVPGGYIDHPASGSKEFLPYLAFNNNNNKISPYIPSQEDLLANDWEIV